jgi:hypothetical protein
MQSLILLIAVLVCPVVMGTMMLMMWRGMRHGGGQAQPPRTSANGAERIDRATIDDGGEAHDGPAARATHQSPVERS